MSEGRRKEDNREWWELCQPEESKCSLKGAESSQLQPTAPGENVVRTSELLMKSESKKSLEF